MVESLESLNPMNDHSPSSTPTSMQDNPVATSVVSRPMICPRCDTMLRINYDEPECLQCGFVDYKYVPPQPVQKKKSIISTGTHYILRYVGDFPSLANTLTHVRLERLRNRVVYGVNCPFCGEDMEQSSLSGKRREVREERYKCTEGHRVSLIPDKTDSLGWK